MEGSLELRCLRDMDTDLTPAPRTYCAQGTLRQGALGPVEAASHWTGWMTGEGHSLLGAGVGQGV